MEAEKVKLQDASAEERQKYLAAREEARVQLREHTEDELRELIVDYLHTYAHTRVEAIQMSQMIQLTEEQVEEINEKLADLMQHVLENMDVAFQVLTEKRGLDV